VLDDALIERILTTVPGKTVGVLGDLFLDRYLDIDAGLTETSVETGLDAYQVTAVRSYPGALGTVINNLAALGVGRILPFAIIGDDGEGYELRQALEWMEAVRSEGIIVDGKRRTPTYTKPMLMERSNPPRELNRLDIKNRQQTPEDAQRRVWDKLERSWPNLDALIVLDQVSETECGVVTSFIRERVAELGARDRGTFILADSRELIGSFRNVHLKPNTAECLKAINGAEAHWQIAVLELAKRCGRRVFCTRGDEGIALTGPGPNELRTIPPFRVSGPIDIVGAGDSCSAGITCAVVSGATLEDAAAFGNLIASITVQQIGTTGTATPAQVRQRWREVARMPDTT
jgi:rfaE bifunctional protein kinase chain/domain